MPDFTSQTLTLKGARIIMKSVLVLYYSRHGATAKMAQHIARGVESVADTQALL